MLTDQSYMNDNIARMSIDDVLQRQGIQKIQL